MPTTPTPNAVARRPRLAVFKFASCDGCQLQLLSCEDELLQIDARVDIVHFLEATSRVEAGPYDVALVEGSITTAADAQRIRQIRADSKTLISIGACATAGGIQALRNWGKHEEFLTAVYAHPEFIQSLATSTAISDHVQVDFELRGCPINKVQLLSVLQDLLRGHAPRVPRHSVCLDCKRSGTVCIAVAQGTPCLGPITQAGCGAICPAYNRGCYGCFGPAVDSNCHALVDGHLTQTTPAAQLLPLLQNFNAAAPQFHECGRRIEESLSGEEPT